MGLRIKLLLLWFSLLLAPLAILGSIGYVYIDGQLKKDLFTYQAELSESQGDSVSRYFQYIDYVVRQSARDAALISALQKTERPAQSYNESIQSFLVDILESEESLVSLSIYSALELQTPLASVGSGQFSKDYFSALPELIDSQESIGFLVAESGTANSKSSVGVLIGWAAIKRNDSVLGYFVAEVAVSPLLKHSLGVVNGTDRADQIVLLDNDGNVVTQSEQVVTRLNNIAQLYQRSEHGFIDTLNVADRSYFASVRPVANGFWLATLTDKQVLFDKRLPYIFIFVGALFFTLLLSGVVFNHFVNNIAIKPIHNLIDATRHIARGEFRPELNIRTKDELGELAVAFRQMGQQLMHTSRRIRQLAYYDPLTQLPNRTTLRETLNRLLARAESERNKAAVLFIDLDDFKKVNDRLGHEAGDELLVQISDRLKNRLRQADILFEQAGVTSVDQLISRRGGDEFNAILSSIKAPHDAAVVAERIIQDLNEPFFVAKSEIHVGASVGIAVFPDDGRDADTLLRNADLAMYEAKARGKNNYHIFTSAINDQVHQRLALENALQIAMVQNQFCLYYQPKVRLADMKPVGFEALIRWQHPKKGLILPGKFIPIAEESNLIRDIGNWILGESMQQIQLWDRMLPKEVRIAINISARQLTQVDLVEQLEMMIEHFGLSPSRLEIELTETSVLQDEQLAVQHLSALRNLGVEISLDDFGTGYSSLSFLRKLPIDTVKIDKSFTANVTQNGEARAIVMSLLSLCRELNVTTIAEGIETTSQLQFLMEHGCDQGQGFLFSEPLPSEEVEQFLEEPASLI
ncbi:hypothetical protein NBRC116494_03510 [Aurantivibrio plasticivorans]